MKHSMKIYLFWFSTLILIILAVNFFRPHKKPAVDESSQLLFDDKEPWFLLDSTMMVKVDTIIEIYKVKTGEKISSLPNYSRSIRSMAMPPSGSHLLVLDDYDLYVYDIKADELSNTDTTKVWSDDDNGPECYGQDLIEFSSNGKYLMVIDFRNQTVSIYQWPGLKYLDTGEIGHHKNFWWENKAGKLYFFYLMNGYKEYTYQMVFPDDSLADTIRFSDPVCIDSVEIKEDN